jgi:hypothetical protein
MAALCSTCPFFHDAGESGTCRANPPVAMLVPTRTLQGEGMALHGFFPPTSENEWCGLHPEVIDATAQTTVEWNRETGFAHAPSLEQARMFAPGETGDVARDALLKLGDCEECDD